MAGRGLYRAFWPDHCHMAVCCTIWLSAVPHGCLLYHMAVCCTTWLSAVPYGCLLYHMACMQCTVRDI